MMVDDLLNKKVQITADALVVIRSNDELTREIELQDPHAQYFVTTEGREMAETIITKVESIYVQYNLARFKYFTSEIASSDFEQLILIGSGYDTRPLWMDKFQNGTIRVFEIDFKEKITSKKARLDEVGIRTPAWITTIGSNLSDGNLLELLDVHGYRPDLKTMVVVEGVLFFLPGITSENLLSSAFLELPEKNTDIR